MPISAYKQARNRDTARCQSRRAGPAPCRQPVLILIGELPSSAVLPDELHFSFDPHLVRDEYAAGLDRLVPLEAPFPPVDLRPKAEARARLPPWVGSPALVLAI